MKKLAALVLILGLVILGVIYASPHAALKGMKSALDADDGERLAGYIDFSVLRDNLKAQLHGNIGTEMGKRDQDNPWVMLGGNVAGSIADRMVESYVTPEGVVQLISGRSTPKTPVTIPGTAAPEAEGGSALKDASLRFLSLSQVEISATAENDRPVKFILSRSTLSWKLTNVILPLDGG